MLQSSFLETMYKKYQISLSKLTSYQSPAEFRKGITSMRWSDPLLKSPLHPVAEEAEEAEAAMLARRMSRLP